jgi:ribonuclease HI
MLRTSKKIIQEMVLPTFEYKLFFDGCSKGNPGLAGPGAVLYKNDTEIWAGTSFVGTKNTNNQAEYAGLILGLQKACELNISSLFVQGDSQLVIYQMTGKYKCNSPNLWSLHQGAKLLEKKFDNIEYNPVLRHLNKRADELSNLALIGHSNSGDK